MHLKYYSSVMIQTMKRLLLRFAPVKNDYGHYSLIQRKKAQKLGWTYLKNCLRCDDLLIKKIIKINLSHDDSNMIVKTNSNHLLIYWKERPTITHKLHNMRLNFGHRIRRSYKDVLMGEITVVRGKLSDSNTIGKVERIMKDD
jgi:hypothetical protein